MDWNKFKQALDEVPYGYLAPLLNFWNHVKEPLHVAPEQLVEANIAIDLITKRMVEMEKANGQDITTQQ